MVGKVVRALGIIAGLWVAGLGAADLALLLFGTPGKAVVEFGVRSYGSRNPYYTDYYSFETPDGKTYKGTGKVPPGLRHLGTLPIKYLSFAPSINAEANSYSLVMYGLLWLSLGALIVWLSAGKRKKAAATVKKSRQPVSPRS
jgi:hypothetical protein